MKNETYNQEVKRKLGKKSLTIKWLYTQLGYSESTRVTFWRKLKSDTFTDKEKKKITALLK